MHRYAGKRGGKRIFRIPKSSTSMQPIVDAERSVYLGRRSTPFGLAGFPHVPLTFTLNHLRASTMVVAVSILLPFQGFPSSWQIAFLYSVPRLHSGASPPSWNLGMLWVGIEEVVEYSVERTVLLEGGQMLGYLALDINEE